MNLEKFTAAEAERLAYAVAALESIAYDLPEKHRPGAARETLAIIESLEPGSVAP